MREDKFTGVFTKPLRPNQDPETRRYETKLTLAGKRRNLGTYDSDVEAAWVVDNAKWWLQDFLPKGPTHLNFQRAQPRPILPVVARLRTRLLESGLQPSYDHGKGFVPPEAPRTVANIKRELRAAQARINDLLRELARAEQYLIPSNPKP